MKWEDLHLCFSSAVNLANFLTDKAGNEIRKLDDTKEQRRRLLALPLLLKDPLDDTINKMDSIENEISASQASFLQLVSFIRF